ncbi:hypothetical protein BJX65DRAFT_311658 [Aspergillus insuetus]
MAAVSWCQPLTPASHHTVTDHEPFNVPNVQRGDVVALKRYQPRDGSMAATRDCLRNIQRELDIVLDPALCGHRNICRLLYIVWEPKSLIPTLSFPTAVYGTLEDFLCGARHGSVQAAQRTLLSADIACGLLALHERGFVHRDIKMANILVDECPVNAIRAVLTDFSGSIRQPRESAAAERGHFTLGWAAPEETAEGRIEDYRRCDVYSFGLVIVTLWMAEYTQPDLSFPGVLASYTKKCIEDVRRLPDEDEKSPLQLAKRMFEPKSLPARLIQMALRRNPEERAQMQHIVWTLGITEASFSNNKSRTGNEPAAALCVETTQEPLALLSNLPTLSGLRRKTQLTIVDKMVQVSEELAGANLKSERIPELSLELDLPRDRLQFWDSIKPAHDSLLSQPFGRDQNAVLATLALDIALCIFYKIRTATVEEALQWVKYSAALGNDWAMAMVTPIALSVDGNAETSPFRPYLVLSSLKGFRVSQRYLQNLFPDDYEALQMMKLDASSAPASACSEARFRSTIGSQNNKSTHLDDEIGRFTKIYGQSPLIDPSTPFETDLPWSNIYMAPPVPQPCHKISEGSSSPDESTWQFGQDIDRFEGDIKCAIDEQGKVSAGDFTITNSLRLYSLVFIYTTHSMALPYRVTHGKVFSSRRIEHLQCLLKAGADPLFYMTSGISPLFAGLLSNDIAIIETLTTTVGIARVALAREIEGMSQVLGVPVGQVCVRAGLAQTLDWLLTQDLFQLADRTSRDGRSLLNIAAGLGDPAIIKVLLKHGASLSQGHDTPWFLPFTRALVDGNSFDTAALLLPTSSEDRKKLFQTPNGNGFTCFGTVLSTALQSMNVITLETIKALGAIGAIELVVSPGTGITVFDVFFSDRFTGRLRRDFSSLEHGIFELLLGMFRAHINDQLSLAPLSGGVRLLHLAVRRANYGAVELLLRFPELDVNARAGPQHDTTAFDLAAYRKNSNLPEYVYKAGDREIAMFHKAMTGTITLLKAHGAKPGDVSDFTMKMLSLRESLDRKMVMAHRIPTTPGEDFERTIENICSFLDQTVIENTEVLDTYRGNWPKKWEGRS